MESLYNASLSITKRGRARRRVPGEEGLEEKGDDRQDALPAQIPQPPSAEPDEERLPRAEGGGEEMLVVIEPSAGPELSQTAVPQVEDEEPLRKKTKSYVRCEHGRQKAYCKDCGGSRICPHGRQKATCKECGGSQICIHKKIRTRCKDCKLLNERNFSSDDGVGGLKHMRV